MKKITFLLLILAFSVPAIATEQAPDKLLYKNLPLSLSTGWGHPSPLETYFYQNNIPYPFQMISTGNYRGHVASWVIKNDRLYLKEISVRSETASPGKYGIKSKVDLKGSFPLVFADWFSGIIECERGERRRENTGTFYFHIRNGKLVSMCEITAGDIKKLQKKAETDTADKDLTAKNEMLLLNRNYVTYYYRLAESDRINFSGNECRLNSDYSRPGPLYQFYADDHLNWPYNWENPVQSGAPHCNWEMLNDSLYLTGVQLHKGLRFDSADKEHIDLEVLMPGKSVHGKIFANWVTGIELIIYGTDTAYGAGYRQFQPTKYTYCRFEKGVLKESYSIAAGFDIKNKEDDLDPGLKKLMKAYH